MKHLFWDSCGHWLAYRAPDASSNLYASAATLQRAKQIAETSPSKLGSTSEPGDQNTVWADSRDTAQETSQKLMEVPSREQPARATEHASRSATISAWITVS